MVILYMYRSTIQIIHINLIWLTKLLSKKHSNRLRMNILKTAADWILQFYNATPDLQGGQILWAFLQLGLRPHHYHKSDTYRSKSRLIYEDILLLFHCSANYTFPLSQSTCICPKNSYSHATSRIKSNFQSPKSHTQTQMLDCKNPRT